MQARRDWQEIFKVMRSRDIQPRLLYPAKLSFRIEGQIKGFPDKKKLKEFIITKPLLYKMSKGLIFSKKIKTMNNKIAINTHLSTIESKNKPSKQEQRQNHGYGEFFDGCQMERVCRRMVRGLRSTNR